MSVEVTTRLSVKSPSRKERLPECFSLSIYADLHTADPSGKSQEKRAAGNTDSNPPSHKTEAWRTLQIQ